MLQLDGDLTTTPALRSDHPAVCGGLDGSPPWQIIKYGETTIAAVSVDQTETRARLGLVFLDGDRVVDVSIQPGAWVGRLRHGAGAIGANPDRWEADIRRQLLDGGAAEGWWTPATVDPFALDLVGVAARAAWPLLRRCTDDVREVPRWSTALLRGPDPVSAVRRQFGSRTTRPLVRAVAQHLCGSVNWWALAMLLAAHTLDADRAVRLLGELADGPDHPCSVEEFRLLERVLGAAPPASVLRFVRSGVEVGPAEVLRVVERWDRAAARVGPLPPTIAQAERRLMQLADTRPLAAAATPASVPGDAPSPPDQSVPGVAGRSAQPESFERLIELLGPSECEVVAPPLPVSRRQARPFETPRYAPQVAQADGVDPGAPFVHDARWRAYHQERDGDVDLLLPVDRDHLKEWSLILANCLDSYADAVAMGELVVLGVRTDERLVGALELDRNGSVVQLLGRANEPLSVPVRTSVVAITERVASRWRSRR